MTGVPLRRRLFALSAAGTLPLAILAGAGLYALNRQYDGQTERVGVELARSVANSIDAELGRSLAVLETLATTRTLDDDDFAGFLDFYTKRRDRIRTRLAERLGVELPEVAAVNAGE